MRNQDEMTEVSGQSWFTHSNTEYWRVDLATSVVASVSEKTREGAARNSGEVVEDEVFQTHYKQLLRAEKSNIEEEKTLQWRQLGLSSNLDQVSPWLKMTGWIDALSDLPECLEELAALTDAPRKDEVELQMLGAIFKETVVSRCMKTVANVPHAYLTWLKSAQSTIDGPKPFSAPGDAATLPRYTNYWVQYICFLFRSLAQGAEILEPEEDNHPGLLVDTLLLARQDFKTIGGLYLTSALHAEMRRINEQLSFLEDIDSLDDINEATRELLASFLFKLSLLSIQSELHLNSPYKSSLMHFLAHMGIDAKKHTLREPHTYTYVLAGIQYICRILILESTLS
ncbi:MAG: hypothetical protein M1829_001105 [Trizodia sp. TS-e1964]|nr:MAG: hypothetical protein M1829_001105 [Trizodia sp. TS-e1964]